MKISYNLLKQFLPLKLTPEKLAQTITEHSLEMELLPSAVPELTGIIAVKVIDVQKHPNADRLRVVKVDAGDRTIEPIVCGAFNFGVGDMVALALPGAKIARNIHSDAHEPFTLGKAKIRGIESSGMICAAFELGLSEEIGEGIMLLDKTTAPGIPLNKTFPKQAAVFEVSIPANRPDLHSHWGLAREISGILGIKLTLKEHSDFLKLPKAKHWKIVVKNKKLCPKYFGIRLSGVKIGPAPLFIQNALKELGLRPVNNVVDITNYAMLMDGQPLHAFDSAKVSGNIIVRNAAKGEKFTALNHKEYELNDKILVIADEKRPLALAGVMGGVDSEINQQTSEIILEAANFNAASTRTTARSLGLRTDASAIFEKGIHPNLVDVGAVAAVELLVKYANATIEEFAGFESAPEKTKTIIYDINAGNALLGVDFKTTEAKKLFSRIGLTVKGTGTKLKVTPPWWRADLDSTPDLAEELMKLSGYTSIPATTLKITPLPATEKSGTDYYRFIKRTKDLWARLGFYEAQNLNFVSAQDIKKFGETRPHIEVENPQSSDQAYLKRHLLIPLLKNAAANHRYSSNVRLFEIGKQYLSFENEPMLLSALLSSKNSAPEKDLMAAKGAVLEYASTLGLKDLVFEKTDKPWLTVKTGGKTIGLVGFIEERTANNFDVENTAVFIKLQLDELFSTRRDVKYAEGNRFQDVQRDVSIVVSKDAKWEHIQDVLLPLLTSKPADPVQFTGLAELFEAPFLASEKSTADYHQSLLKQGQKNYGIRLILKPKNRTLTEPEIASILEKIVLKLKQEIKAEIR